MTSSHYFVLAVELNKDFEMRKDKKGKNSNLPLHPKQLGNGLTFLTLKRGSMQKSLNLVKNNLSVMSLPSRGAILQKTTLPDLHNCTVQCVMDEIGRHSFQVAP